MKNLSILLIILLLVYIMFRKMSNKEGFINPVSAKITSPFAEINKDLRKGSHSGVDLKTIVGTPVKNPFDGKILSRYDTGKTGGGMQLRVKHSNGFITGYAHLSKNDFYKVGDTVKQGALIALTGATGHVTGAHLHLTLTDTVGKKVDPAKYFTFKS